jgi:hypothetical protein
MRTAIHLRMDNKLIAPKDPETGKAGYALAWLLGVPLPLLLIIYLISHGC